MPSVYDPDNFIGRVNMAAGCIAKQRESTRAFDTCFEMNDGDAVVLALYRIVKKNPTSQLARHIWKYLIKDTAEMLDARYPTENLVELAKKMREPVLA